MSDSSPIFVVGSGRSGTTIIKRCLESSPETVVLDFEPMLFISANEKFGLVRLLESDLPDSSIRETIEYLGSLYKRERKSGYKGFYKFIERTVYTSLLEDLEKSCIIGDAEQRLIAVRRFYKSLSKEITPSGQLLIDDHILNGLYVSEIIKIFPGSKFIHTIRNGHDVACSFQRLGWGGGAGYTKLVRIWLDRVTATQKLCRAFCYDNYLEVDFRELTEETEKCVEKIYNFCDIEFKSDYVNSFSKARAKKYDSDKSFPIEFTVLAENLNREYKWF